MLLGLKGTGPSGFPSSMACAPEAKHHVDADGGVGNSCVKSRFSPPPPAQSATFSGSHGTGQRAPGFFAGGADVGILTPRARLSFLGGSSSSFRACRGRPSSCG